MNLTISATVSVTGTAGERPVTSIEFRDGSIAGSKRPPPPNDSGRNTCMSILLSISSSWNSNPDLAAYRSDQLSEGFTDPKVSVSEDGFDSIQSVAASITPGDRQIDLI